MSILITDATGTVGRYLVSILLGNGRRIAAVSRNPDRAHLLEGLQIFEGGPSSPTTLFRALDGLESIFISPNALGGITAGQSTAELLKDAKEHGTAS